jgi:hypothetical protein
MDSSELQSEPISMSHFANLTKLLLNRSLNPKKASLIGM